MKKIYKAKLIGDGITPETAFRPDIADILLDHSVECVNWVVSNQDGEDFEVTVDTSDVEHTKIKDTYKFKEK